MYPNQKCAEFLLLFITWIGTSLIFITPTSFLSHTIKCQRASLIQSHVFQLIRLDTDVLVDRQPSRWVWLHRRIHFLYFTLTCKCFLCKSVIDTLTRRHADTPTRRHADTPTRRHACNQHVHEWYIGKRERRVRRAGQGKGIEGGWGVGGKEEGMSHMNERWKWSLCWEVEWQVGMGGGGQDIFSG